MKNYSGIHDCIDTLVKVSGKPRKECETTMKNVLEVLEIELLKSDKDGIQFIDFFTLKKMPRKAKLGRNPKNPDVTFTIPAKIGFKAELGKEFDKKLNPVI